MSARTSRQSDSVRPFLMFLLHHLESSGISRIQLRNEARLPDGWLEETRDEDLVGLVPGFLKAAQQLSKDELLCLHAGERFHFCLTGLGGLAAAYAPTPELAIETYGRFLSGDGLLEVRASKSPVNIRFSLEVRAPWPEPICEQIVDGFVACLAAALRSLCVEPISPEYVNLARRRSAHSKEYASTLRCPVVFDSLRNEIAFSAEALAGPSKNYDPLLYEQLNFISDLRTESPAGRGPLRQLIEQSLRGGAQSIEEVAETLRLKTRTLQRRLQTEGVTFRRVLNETRVDMAQQLLLDTSMPLTDIAKRLHYADDKALRKAIKRETGKTPGEIRARSLSQ